MAEEIQIAEYDTRWPARFATEAEQIRRLLDTPSLEIEHHGSTAVPGLAAKPVIDMLVAVDSIGSAEQYAATLVPNGYEPVLKRAVAISPNLVLHRDQGYALRNLAEAFARSGSPGVAITRAKGIADENWRQAALHAIAEIEADARSRPWVEQTVAAARLPIDRARILASVAKRWAGSGDVPAARWAIAEALRMVQDVRITKSPDVLVTIEEAMVTVGDLEGAHRVASRI